MSLDPLRSVFKAFLDAHHDVEICVAESSRGELFTNLSYRRLDAVIATGEPATETGDGMLLSNEDIFLAVPSDHDLAAHDRLDWNDVREATFLLSLRDPTAEIHDFMLRRVSHLGQTIHVQRHGVG
ncbi:LysR substrate-binding domain-containing protein [uncultured Roseobacter sp.]|uniref:LysR substrate-binding domain-containing protein n=1 Tax=uncultured Roseobacter sp. TaxID=114847 RepID=UPI00261D2A03|nr:LysR substrate-binding domain-containing protein [uncultured Roseobacter sp.]